MSDITNPFSEILAQQDEIKEEYNSMKATLNAKKEDMWKYGNIDKWQMNELKDNVDRDMLLKDKNYAMKKMCYDEMLELMENYNKLGYFYYSNSEQFYRIIKMFEDESIEVMKNFSNQMGPTVSDTVKIYSDLASCDI